MSHPKPVIYGKHGTRYFPVIALSLLCILMMKPLFAQEKTAPSLEEASDRQARSAQEPTRKIGEATSNLLSLQVSGDASSPVLPMLGVTANLSWQRYLESFKYKIPERFDNKIQPGK